MVKSAVYQGQAFLGEVEIYPYDSYTGPWIREIRISHFSQPSERCLPLAILHTVASGGFRFKMEATKRLLLSSTENSPLSALHSACLQENKTAVVPLGEQELHLVAMTSRDSLMHSAGFWGFVAPLRLYDCSLAMLNLRCLGIVFDLDETLIVANTMRSFEDRIDALQRKINNEIDPQRIAGMLAEIKRYQDDKYILKQYAENDQVVDNGKIFEVQMENISPLSYSNQLITRPVIRMKEKNIILTRVNPLIRDTSVLVRLRPAWEDLRGYLTARGRKRFEVFVCTMAERDYALEMWRLLDPDSNLIDFTKLLDRIVCVKSGSRKSLINVFQDGICHPKMGLVIDDRVKVWDEKDQPRVHVVPAFAPYYAPQAEENSNIPVLCVARNVACNVRGSFFKEFDEELLPRINQVSYEDDYRHIPLAPDVGNYLLSEDDTSASNANKEQPFADGISDAEVERRLKEASCSAQASQPMVTTLGPKPASSLPVMASSSGGPTLSCMQIMGPHPMNQGPQPVTLGRPLVPIAFSEPSFRASPATEEGEVPELELDPDTRRRLLILQHGQDTRDSTDSIPPLTVMPLNVPVPPAPPTRTWFPMEEANQRKTSRSSAKFSLEPEIVHFDDKRPQHPSFFLGGVPFSSERIVLENRQLPLKLNHGSDAGRTNHITSNYNSFRAEEMQLRQSFPSHMAGQFGSGLKQSDSTARVLDEIATKCGAKVEFRSAVCDTLELRFLVEVWFVGEKLGEGVGRTRMEAQHRAAEISLRNLAERYISNSEYGSTILNGGLLKSSQFKQNGSLVDSDSYRYSRDDLLPVASTSDDFRFIDHRLDSSRRKSPVAALKELCIAEGYTLDFQEQHASSMGSVVKGEVSAEVHIAGRILGQGVGATWEKAKLQAAEEALQNFRFLLAHIPHKRSSSPRSSTEIPSKRLKPDFPEVLQRIPTSSRYTNSETPVP